MNPPEALAILRMVKACCPSQAIDDYTADAWALALDDVRFVDAREAVTRLVKMDLEPGQSRYIEPGHIRADVKKLRSERIRNHPPVEPPADMDPRDVQAYIDWRLDTRNRIAGGEVIEPEVRQVVERHVDYAAIVSGVPRD